MLEGNKLPFLFSDRSFGHSRFFSLGVLLSTILEHLEIFVEKKINICSRIWASSFGLLLAVFPKDVQHKYFTLSFLGFHWPDKFTVRHNCSVPGELSMYSNGCEN